MRKRLIIFLAVNVWGVSGCAPSRSNDVAVFEPQPTGGHAAALDQKRSGASVHSAAGDKDTQTRDTAKGKVAAKDGNTENKPADMTENKPADMKVANAFDHDPYLSSKVKPLLPPHSTVTDAAAGFKNQKQFIAAMHLSKNLHIPFDQIKTRMTGEHRMSLHDALRDLRPDMAKNDLKAELNKAEKQAREDENQAKDEAKKAAAQEKVAAN